MSDQKQTESPRASDPAVGSSDLLGIEGSELAIQLCKQTKTHKEWLAVVRFGLHTLLDDQVTLIECVFLEAERERECKKNTQSTAVNAWEILEELELKIVNA